LMTVKVRRCFINVIAGFGDVNEEDSFEITFLEFCT
jgi:hypothetical protein